MEVVLGRAALGIACAGGAAGVVGFMRDDPAAGAGIVSVSAVLAGGLAWLRSVAAQERSVWRAQDALHARNVETLAQALATVHESHALDAAMARETPNGLVVIDAGGRVLRANPALFRLLPVRDTPTGRRPIETIPVPELQDAVDETARTRQPVERAASVDGRDLVVRALPLEDADGCMGVVLDVTTVRAAEKARRDFVANVSHELRTPVTAILGWAEALAQEREDLPPHVHDMVDAIDRNARRLGLLIEDVLQLSRIEARRTDLPVELEAIAPLVAEVVARHAARAEQQGIELCVEVPPDVEAPLNAEAFEHALGNLVDNALKYTPRAGRVVVTAQVGAEGVDVAVSDTGIGIAAVHHARIFERFYRVDAGRDRAVGGTGLGLALVKHLCRAMRADVLLASEPGEGSTFTIRLPARHTNVTRRA